MRRMTLEMSDRIHEVLTNFAAANGISNAEALRRALAVLDLAAQEKAEGRSLGIVEEDAETHELHAVSLIVGIWR